MHPPSSPIRHLLRSFTLLCVATLSLQANAAGRRVALVVGNSNYAAISNLGNNPRNDADDITRALQGFGFSVTILKDATRRDLNTALESFGRAASGSEAALFYFAGHGMQIRGDNYLMPVNATAESEAAVRDEGVNLSRVLDELEGSAAVKIVLIDACRDNPITGRFRTAQRGLAPPAAPPSGTVIAFAAEPGKTAANTGGNGRNGVFTAGLLTAFKGKDLSLDSVLTVASEEVETHTQRAQTPYVNGPKTVQKKFQFRVTVDPGPAATEAQFWDSIKSSEDLADFEEYKRKYPQGQFVGLADNRIRRLRVTGTGGLVGVRSDAAAELVAGQTLKECAQCPEMVVIPAGSFTMGSSASEQALANASGAEAKTTSRESPQHIVNVKSFAAGKYAVTKGQFAQFVSAKSYFTDAERTNGCVVWTTEGKREADKNWRNAGFDQADDHPVVCITWNDAKAYALWVSETSGKPYRLLSEAEREYATRAGTQTAYWWGDSIKTTQANYAGTATSYNNSPQGEYRQATVPVSSFSANPFGLYNVHGNVGEWVEDCSHNNYSGAPTDGSAWTMGCGFEFRVRRGGSWKSNPEDLRSANREWGTPLVRTNSHGFRLARTLVTP